MNKYLKSFIETFKIFAYCGAILLGIILGIIILNTHPALFALLAFTVLFGVIWRFNHSELNG